MEPHVDCPVTPALGEREGLVWTVDTGDLGLGLLCTATDNKLATVLASVWLPIITFCLLRYHKTETLNPETEIIHLYIKYCKINMIKREEYNFNLSDDY